MSGKGFIKGFFRLAGAISAVAAAAAAVAFVCERIDEIREKGNAVLHKPFGIYEKYIKRPLDCFLSTGALIVFSPILLITGLLVRHKLGSPVFFTQDRPGRFGKIFKLYKFRTMT
ncbi:MAG: sugar transferase, partial [Ruminococcus sp.]|nr:sugar transferase [Ruminococcus sp.]